MPPVVPPDPEVPAEQCPEVSRDVADGVPLPSRRLLVLSLDGLGSVQLEQALDAGRLVALRELERRGAFTHNARTDVTHTVTLPAHVTMLTGLPVLEVAGAPDIPFHAYTGFGNPGAGTTIHAGAPNGRYVPSLFDVAHDHGVSTCLFAGKTKFSLFDSSYDEAAGADDTGPCDHGNVKLDDFEATDHDSTALVDRAVDAVREATCDLLVVHLADLDQEGHSTAWGSAEWHALLDDVDDYVGSLWGALEDSEDEWALVVTSDHGGEGTGHFDEALLANFKIPFYVVAPGVPGGADLYALSGGSRVDPGDEQPGYDALGPPIRNGDVANLSLRLLGLPEIEGSLMRGMTLTGDE